MSGEVVSVSNSKGGEDGSRAVSKIVLVKSVLRKTGSSLSGSAQRVQAAPAEGELQPVAQDNVVVNAIGFPEGQPNNSQSNNHTSVEHVLAPIQSSVRSRSVATQSARHVNRLPHE